MITFKIDDPTNSLSKFTTKYSEYLNMTKDELNSSKKFKWLKEIFNNGYNLMLNDSSKLFTNEGACFYYSTSYKSFKDPNTPIFKTIIDIKHKKEHKISGTFSIMINIEDVDNNITYIPYVECDVSAIHYDELIDPIVDKTINDKLAFSISYNHQLRNYLEFVKIKNEYIDDDIKFIETTLNHIKIELKKYTYNCKVYINDSEI